MGLGEIKSSARTRRAGMACFRAVIVIWLYSSPLEMNVNIAFLTTNSTLQVNL